MENYIIVAIIALILGLAVWYLVRTKKKGRKCVGCPYADSCDKCKCSEK